MLSVVKKIFFTILLAQFVWALDLFAAEPAPADAPGIPAPVAPVAAPAAGEDQYLPNFDSEDAFKNSSIRLLTVLRQGAHKRKHGQPTLTTLITTFMATIDKKLSDMLNAEDYLPTLRNLRIWLIAVDGVITAPGSSYVALLGKVTSGIYKFRDQLLAKIKSVEHAIALAEKADQQAEQQRHAAEQARLEQEEQARIAQDELERRQQELQQQLEEQRRQSQGEHERLGREALDREDRHEQEQAHLQQQLEAQQLQAQEREARLAREAGEARQKAEEAVNARKQAEENERKEREERQRQEEQARRQPQAMVLDGVHHEEVADLSGDHAEIDVMPDAQPVVQQDTPSSKRRKIITSLFLGGLLVLGGGFAAYNAMRTPITIIPETNTTSDSCPNGTCLVPPTPVPHDPTAATSSTYFDPFLPVVTPKVQWSLQPVCQNATETLSMTVPAMCSFGARCTEAPASCAVGFPMAKPEVLAGRTIVTPKSFRTQNSRIQWTLHPVVKPADNGTCPVDLTRLSPAKPLTLAQTVPASTATTPPAATLPTATVPTPASTAPAADPRLVELQRQLAEKDAQLRAAQRPMYKGVAASISNGLHTVFSYIPRAW